jgi:NAD-dependent SIR2 family protein deacetylase
MSQSDRSKLQKPPTSNEHAFMGNIFELQGNIEYMRCPDFSDKRFYQTPTRDEVAQSGNQLLKNDKSGKIMRPNIMLQDDVYLQKYCRSKAAWDFINKKCDGIIVIGSSLETSIAHKMVSNALTREAIPVVYVNFVQDVQSTLCGFGFGINVYGSCEEKVPTLFEELIKLKSSK